MAKPKLWPLLLVSALFVAPYIFSLFYWPYRVSSGDEPYQIQAAQHLLHGWGYNATIYAMPLDLAEGKFNFLYNWPIGYSAVIWFFLKLGLSSGMAAALWQSL